MIIDGYDLKLIGWLLCEWNRLVAICDEIFDYLDEKIKNEVHNKRKHGI